MSRYGIAPRGVIHIGAHTGQEHPIYTACGIHDQVWVEPQPEAFARLTQNLPDGGKAGRVRAFNVACGPQRGTAKLHRVGGNGESDSLLAPKEMLQDYANFGFADRGTIEVPVVPVDELLAENGLDPSKYNLLSVDVQGYELPVLRGAVKTLPGIDAIISEISEREMYEGNTLAPQLDAFLAEHGFVRVVSRLSKRTRHGNALYLKRSLLRGWPNLMHKLVGPVRR